MDIFLIWGFLGSGKTTFINYLLSSDYFSNKKTIIIENESGKESVDGEILKSSSFDVIDLKGGCACCSLKSKLIEVLNKLSMSHKTEIVVIEASGISSLEDMLHISFLNKSKIFSILDVTQYDFLKKLNYQFYRKQYSLSSTIVLTKTDAMNPCEVKNIVEELMSFNPQMRIISDYKNVRKNEWNEIFAVKNILLNRTAPILNNFRLPKFNIETFYFEDPIDYNFFYNYFEYIDKLFNNNIIRAKGLFKDNDKWIKFDP